MSRATPQIRNFAKRLIAYDASGRNSAKTQAPGPFDACEKLRSQLATLMGNEGVRALFARALALASEEVPWLRAVPVKSDGTLGGLEELDAPLSSEALSLGRIALMAQLLGLLVAFIGESLTLRLVREVWPKAPLDELELVKQDKHEKTEYHARSEAA